MKKVTLSLLAGLVIGIIDIIPMFIKNLPWTEISSALSLWIIAAFLIHNSILNVKYSALKGVIHSMLLWIPASFLVFPQGMEIITIITITNIVLGSILGYVIMKIKNDK